MLSFVVLILTRLLGFGGERGKYNTYFIFYIYFFGLKVYEDG